MDLEKLTPELIKQLPSEDLIELMYSSFEDLIDIRFTRVDMSHLANRMFKPDFEVIMREIKYSQEEHFHVTIPRINEERQYLSKVWKCELENYRFFPESNGYVDCDSDITIKAYGLVEIVHRGKFITRMNKNHTFTNKQKVYEEYSFFYFDYKERKFIQAPSDQLRKLKSKFNVKGEMAPEAIEFYRREQLLDESYHRLKVISIEKGYQQKFLNFINNDYKSQSDVDIRDYLINYYRFLGLDLENWLKIKLLFSSITKDEYKRLNIERDKLMTLISNYYEGNEDLHNVLTKLKTFKEGKPEKITAGLLMQGFIHYDSERKILYPNIVEVERRRLLRLDSFYDDDSYKSYLEEVMIQLDKKRTE